MADQILAGAIAGTAASDVYGDAEDEPADSPDVTPLEDVVQAEEADEIDEVAFDE